jgi:hypothetical protein
MMIEESKHAKEFLNEFKEGWESWPETKALPKEFGFRVSGKVMGPVGHAFEQFLMVITIIGLLALALIDWQVAVGLGVFALVSWKILIRPMLESSVSAEITREYFRVNFKKYKRFGPSGTPIPYEFLVDPHEKADREAQIEYENNQRGSTKYRRSLQVVLGFLEKRVVIASIYNDPKKADQLCTRLHTLDEYVREYYQIRSN